MSDAKLWIDEVGYTATITGANVSYTMPLWVFEDMRDIIVAEEEKKVEVTHRDFDIQQELLDRYRAENRKLRNLIDGFIFCDSTSSASSDDCIGCPLLDQSPHNYRCTKEDRMREMGVTSHD